MRCVDFFGKISLLKKIPKKTTRRNCYMNVSLDASPFKNKNSRQRINSNISAFNQALEQTGSQRAAAKITGIPRSSARYHQQRQSNCDIDEEVKAFFYTSAGMKLLHRLSLAAEFVFTQVGEAGIRLIKLFYELSQLDRFIACSLGSLHKRVKTMENNLIEYGHQQEQALASHMPAKEITCCLDETFPSGICLVGMEPESNFILLEEMADKRDCDTWNQAMKKRLEVFPVKVVQVTSDGARALIKYTEQCLNSHHSPDLFHIQQDISKGTSAPLRAKVKSRKKSVDQCTLALEACEQAKQADEMLENRRVGRPIDHELRVAVAEVELEEAKKEYESAEKRYEVVRENRVKLGEVYHPFDIDTAKRKTGKRLKRQLTRIFDDIDARAEEAELRDNSRAYVKKARNRVEAMVCTLNFFWAMVAERVKLLDVSVDVKHLFLEVLLPAVYFELHAWKVNLAEEKYKKLAMSNALHEQLDRNANWKRLSVEKQNELKKRAVECAQLFQRSSSNVEGRNGYLSLHHHVYKKMNPRKMQAATIIHNYFIKRKNSTTAAERFFGTAPEDVFSWLLTNTDYPASPAKRRSVVRKLSCAA